MSEMQMGCSCKGISWPLYYGRMWAMSCIALLGMSTETLHQAGVDDLVPSEVVRKVEGKYFMCLLQEVMKAC